MKEMRARDEGRRSPFLIFLVFVFVAPPHPFPCLHVEDEERKQGWGGLGRAGVGPDGWGRLDGWGWAGEDDWMGGDWVGSYWLGFGRESLDWGLLDRI